MKILLLTEYSVFSLKAGAEKIFWEMANAFCARNHDIVAVGFDGDSVQPSYPANKNVKCINLGYGLNIGFFVKLRAIKYFNKIKRKTFKNSFYNHEKAKRLAVVLNKENPDIIVSYQPSMTHILKEYLNIDNIPIITMFHSAPGYSPDVNLDREDWCNALENTDCVQVLMPSFIDMVKSKITPKRVISIPNPVKQYYNIKPDYDNKTIIHVGRLDKYVKWQHIIIEAFNLLKDRYPDWNVEFWGDINTSRRYFKECMMLIKKYKLENNIKFCGVTDCIEEKLSNASIFAFPSRFEGFPLALTEGMSIGLPVIGFKSAVAVNELIINGISGYLCEDNVENFATNLEKLMKNIELRKKFGENAKLYIRKFDEKFVWDEWEKLLIDLSKLK